MKHEILLLAEETGIMKKLSLMVTGNCIKTHFTTETLD